jgi:RNA polymerase sigma-70 factor (ECF subfamily)
MGLRQDADTDELVELAGGGDAAARQLLLMRHRKRLRQMVAFRLDRRLAARVDPSDVVQEAIMEAAVRLSDYLERRPLPFYPWLRQLAWDKLIELHRRHIHAQKRSITREDADVLGLPDESVVELASRLLAGGSSPSHHVLREELRDRVRAALVTLAERDREILVLRHLEQLSVREIAVVIGISEGAVKVRHLRALERFRRLLVSQGEGLA